MAAATVLTLGSPCFQEDQEAADIVVTEARCAGGDEGVDAAACSAPAEEAGMDTDAPKGGDTLGAGALVIKRQAPWTRGGQPLSASPTGSACLTLWSGTRLLCDRCLLPWPAWKQARGYMAELQALVHMAKPGFVAATMMRILVHL